MIRVVTLIGGPDDGQERRHDSRAGPVIWVEAADGRAGTYRRNPSNPYQFIWEGWK